MNAQHRADARRRRRGDARHRAGMCPGPPSGPTPTPLIPYPRKELFP